MKLIIAEKPSLARNIVAGIGRAQLKYAEEHRDRKEKIYRRYEEGFKGLPVSMNPYEEGTKPNFWLSCMLIDEGCAVDPMTVMQALADANVEARPIWKPMHMQPIYREHPFVSAEDNCDIGADLFARGLCLPSDNKMTPEEQDVIIEAVKNCFR